MPPELDRLADDYWDYRLSQQPTYGLLLGEHRYDTEMEQLSEAAEQARNARLQEFADAAAAVDPAGLSADDRVTRGVLAFEAAADAARGRHPALEVAVNPAMGFHVMLFTMVPHFPLTEPAHAENVLVKLSKLGDTFDQWIDRLRAGVAAGRTPPALHCRMVVEQIDEYLATPVDADDPMMQIKPPFSGTEADEWRGRLRRVVGDVIRPAYARLRDAVAAEVAPAGRPEDRVGVCWLEGGEDWYADAIDYFVTLPRPAAEIHQIGLDTVAALEDEYRTLGPEVLGTADVGEIYRRLRDDPDLHHTAGADLVAHSERAMAKARAAMGGWFDRLPEADCLVMETHSGPTAFYQRPAVDGSRPGIFFINTKDPSRWGTFEVEAMAYHEGIPGHHLQLAIAGELPGVPAFRRHAMISAYAEGWGLYTERLADEMGLYTTGLDRMGMLAADSMRACRLVVDTGMHALGWSRRRAIDYMLAHSPMTEGTVSAEVDRYIGMPAQALAYMMGRREIVRMRRDAEAALGDRFDIKGFHDTVLGSGLVPLGLLEDLVQAWVAGVQAAA